MRGKGFPVEIKRKIAENFAEHGYNKQSRKEAQQIYGKMTGTDRQMCRYVTYRMYEKWCPNLLNFEIKCANE